MKMPHVIGIYTDYLIENPVSGTENATDDVNQNVTQNVTKNDDESGAVPGLNVPRGVTRQKRERRNETKKTKM